MEGKKVKLLVSGNLNGEIKKLNQIVEKIQSTKGEFDALFSVGKFFPPSVAEMKDFHKDIFAKAR